MTDVLRRYAGLPDRAAVRRAEEAAEWSVARVEGALVQFELAMAEGRHEARLAAKAAVLAACEELMQATAIRAEFGGLT